MVERKHNISFSRTLLQKKCPVVNRRQKARLGAEQALVATAHKIARTIYHMLKNREAYVEGGAATYEKQQQDRELAYLKKKAAKLGFVLALPQEMVLVLDFRQN